MRFIFAISLAVVSMVTPTQAYACAMSGSVNDAHEDLRADRSLRKIEGSFFVDGEFEWPEGYLANATVNGRVVDERGKVFPVRTTYNEVLVYCGLQFTPPIDATGTFWISRRKRDSRHDMKLWEGQYTPEALEENETKTVN